VLKGLSQNVGSFLDADFDTINMTGCISLDASNCDSSGVSIKGDTYISGDTVTVKGRNYVNVSGSTTNISGSTSANISGKTVNITGSDSGGVNIKSDGGCITIETGGDPCGGIELKADTVDISGTTKISGNTNIADIIRVKTAAGNCVEVTRPLCVTGTVTASGAIYSSDRRLKDNIMNIDEHEINMAKNVHLRSFTLRDDAEQRKTYGVIAQEVLDTGLSELVHTREDGMYGVDYTSLLILKVAYLENELKKTNEEFEKVKAANQSNQDKLTELIQNIKKLENKFDDMNNKD
jgi:hypothetical protein